MSDFDNVEMENLERNLYHYTSGSALFSILNNKELWLTNSNFMNDQSEIDYACNRFIENVINSNIKFK